MFLNRFDISFNWKALRFYPNRVVQSSELNEMQSIQSHELRTIAGAIIENGAILKGAGISIENGMAIIEESTVFHDGYAVHVPSSMLSIASGVVKMGVVISTETVDGTLDTSLLCQASAEGKNEMGAGRLIVVGAWAEDKDLGNEPFYPVFTFTDGVLSTVKHIAPELEGMRKLVGRYDYDSNGSYVVRGLVSSYERDVGSKHLLSISDGVVHVAGEELFFEYAQKVEIDKINEVENVISEPFVFSKNSTYPVRHTPLKNIERVVGVASKIESITHGGYQGSSDILGSSPVVKILSIEQGTKTFKKDVDFTQDGDKIDWSLNGDEPSAGSTYVVVYHYRTVLIPKVNKDSFRVDGLVEGSSFFVNYNYFLKRIDRIILTKMGDFLVLKGKANAYPVEAKTKGGVSLATVELKAGETPIVYVDYHRAYTHPDVQKMARKLESMEYNMAKLSLDYDARGSDPSTDKKEIFVDPFLDDDLRDKGKQQNAEIVNGSLQPKIEWNSHSFVLQDDLLLPYHSIEVLVQAKKSGHRKINAYIDEVAPINSVKLEPSSFRWIAESYSYNGSSSSTEITQSTKVFDVPQTKLKIEAQKFIDEEVSIYIDGFFIKKVKAVNGEVDTEISTPKGLKNGLKLVRLVGLKSSIELSSVWHTTALKRVVTFAWSDPLAQTILLSEDMFLSELSLHIEAVPISWLKIHIVKTLVGTPNMKETISSKSFMASSLKKGWQNFKLDPSLLEANVEYAVVIEAGDSVGKCAIAKIGAYDLGSKSWITKQPYMGVLLSSANSSTWTAHQKEDLTFKLKKASFQSTKTVEIGRMLLRDATDLMLLAEVTEFVGTEAIFLVKLSSRSEEMQLTPYRRTSIEKYSGELILSVVLNTKDKHLSPIVESNVVLGVGKVIDSTYVSRSFSVSGTEIKVYVDTEEPNGSSVSVEVEENGVFQPLARDNSKSRFLGDGKVEVCFKKDALNTQETRVKILLNTNESSRAMAKNLRAIIN